jgi:hypothetical protein
VVRIGKVHAGRPQTAGSDLTFITTRRIPEQSGRGKDRERRAPRWSFNNRTSACLEELAPLSLVLKKHAGPSAPDQGAEES